MSLRINTQAKRTFKQFKPMEKEENVIYEPNKKVYYSDIVNSYILDAITGCKYPYKVGSFGEERFFKVRSTTAYNNKEAVLQFPASASNANQAFYESPFVFMNYHNVKLSEDIINNWKCKTQKFNTTSE